MDLYAFLNTPRQLLNYAAVYPGSPDCIQELAIPNQEYRLLITRMFELEF
jgi:hypothetical protein